MRLLVARDVYGLHYDELPPERLPYVDELIALRQLEKEATHPQRDQDEAADLTDLPVFAPASTPPTTPR